MTDGDEQPPGRTTDGDEPRPTVDAADASADKASAADTSTGHVSASADRAADASTADVSAAETTA
ncbi:hypothetical protein G3I24_45695, partial [Micromonospora aurantiaca]|nr:hypothetical protein [Micromonospora aurantiaca]